MSRIGLLTALLSTAATAQVQDPEALVALLKDPSGTHVAGAHGEVTCRAIGALPALGDLLDLSANHHDLTRALPALQRLAGRSDARGLLRLAADGEPLAGVAGSGMVSTEHGLGALLVDLQPGRAQRIDLQPMAALTTATGSEELVVFARAHTIEGVVVTLPPRRGTVVRLPAADYELWISSSEGWTWQRRNLVSGKPEVLDLGGPALRLRRDSKHDRVHPDGRPDVPLFGGDDLEVVLRGAAITAHFVARNDFNGPMHGPQALPAAANDGVVRWPPDPRAATLVDLRGVPAPPDATAPLREAVFSLQRRADGTWRVLGATTARRSGPDPGSWFQLPQPPAGDTWLLFVAHGTAPQARPWQGQPRFPFAYERGVPLVVLAKDDKGLPIVDLAVDYVPDDMAPATVTGYSDGRGQARLGPVLAPGVLRISDPRFANQTIELATIPLDGVPVTVAAGSELRGVTKWADGTPARGVVVTLRDPSGVLRPAQRVVVSGDGGTFTFAGLHDDRALALFAATHRDGRTWSAKLDRLLAGGDDVELVLHDEDPKLGPGGGR